MTTLVSRLRRASQRDAVFLAVHDAIIAGYTIGRVIRYGSVRCVVIGYNIGGSGLYRGSQFPLLVATPLGVTKCRLREVNLA